jgi:hypothetical protein
VNDKLYLTVGELRRAIEPCSDDSPVMVRADRYAEEFDAYQVKIEWLRDGIYLVYIEFVQP